MRKNSPPKRFWDLVRRTGQAWGQDRIPRQAAALAFYTSFTVAPLLLLGLGAAGLLFGEEKAQRHVVGQLTSLVGPAAAGALQDLAFAARRSDGSLWAAFAGIIALLFGASGVFAELQTSLNIIWKVRKKAGRGVLGMLRDRFLSFSMVAGTGFLLLVTLLFSAALELLGSQVRGWDSDLALVKVLHQVVDFGVVAGLVACLFRILPDAKTRWRDLWPGALLTSLLFTLGKHFIGLYLGRTSVTSAYGAAGSFIVVLLWIYYSSQIFLLGAEFTRVSAEQWGQGARPDADAVRVSEGVPNGAPRGNSRNKTPSRAIG